jgi:hypothetical protein
MMNAIWDFWHGAISSLDNGEGWHFRWSDGHETHSFKQAREFARAHPELAQRHISDGHFQAWHCVKIGQSGTVLDLTSAGAWTDRETMTVFREGL